ncbi:hypothetical protein DY000_02059309 [Brassica cretica]|uniref:Uncharacterized protein n=1 Tax=Brassica cretica TaxID=69181 RepID=A0ABQ7AXV3_BRACR|nr:hypothetical protein DY000_02059309 [Brassica cretica]
MKQNKAGSFYLCGCLGIEKSFSMEKVRLQVEHWPKQEGLPWIEIMYVNCTSLTENIYILKGRKALLQLNEEKPIVLYEGSSHDSSVNMDYGVAENARCISDLKSGQDSGKEEEEDQEIGANNVFKKGCLLMIHGRVEEKHASGQCFEIRAR